MKIPIAMVPSDTLVWLVLQWHNGRSEISGIFNIEQLAIDACHSPQQIIMELPMNHEFSADPVPDSVIRQWSPHATLVPANPPPPVPARSNVIAIR